MAQFTDLKLYVRPGCPFCARVDRFMEKNDIQVEHLDVTEGTNGDDLERIGGKRTCPCLLIDGKPMYESMDIIKYLAERIGLNRK
ncbi:MAG: glutaredoxin family protein [Atopobiaceae bacterium]